MVVYLSYLTLACPPGTYGDNCTTSCPNLHYGENCGLKCECTTDERCDPAIGCVSITTGKRVRNKASHTYGQTDTYYKHTQGIKVP